MTYVPTTRNDSVDADLAAALRIALNGGQPGGVEPVDWLSTSTPTQWRCGGEIRAYDWLPPTGGDPYDVGGTLYS
jgi:alpha-galactosidase